MANMHLKFRSYERQPKAIALCEAQTRAPWREIF
jgi:hypothetical protein